MYVSHLSDGLMQMDFICAVAARDHVKPQGYGCHFRAFLDYTESRRELCNVASDIAGWELDWPWNQKLTT